MAVYCSHCSTANREGSRFCNNCGKPMEAPPPATCPVCQASVASYSAFCQRCGARLPETPADVPTPPEPITEMDAAPSGAADEESEVVSLDQVPVTRPLSASATGRLGAIVPSRSLAEDERDAAASPLAPPETVTAEPATRPIEGTRSVQPLLRVRPSVGHPAPPANAPMAQPNRSDLFRRLSYLALAVAIVVGLLLPPGTLGRAAAASPEVIALYNTIEALPERAAVLVSFDYEPSVSDEMSPLAHAVLAHLMRQKARLLIMSLQPQGPALANQVMQSLSQRYAYSYGSDYVNLGYLAGDEAALAALSKDMNKAFASDFVEARPLAAFSAGRGIASVADFDLLIELSGDENGVRRWVEQVQSRKSVKLAAATSAAALPLAFPYLQSGQIAGLAGGWPAAAEYERLLGEIGPATRTLDAQTLGHIVILLLIILGNLTLLFARQRKPQ